MAEKKIKKRYQINEPARDITEYRQAEEKLKQTLSLLRSTLQSTADGILVVADNGRIVDFNEQFAKFWDIPTTILDLRDDEMAIDFVLDQLKNPEQFIAKVREVCAHPEATSFDVLEFKDGRIFERYSQPQRIDGNPVGRVWSFRDVTERVKAEQALRSSEEKFRAITTTAADAIILMDDKGKISYWNPSAARIFGFSAEEAMGRDLHLLLAPEHNHEAYKGGFSDFTKTGLGPVVGRTVELMATKKDGTEFPMEISTSAMNLGEHWHALGIIRDITARKQADEALRKSEQYLSAIIENEPECVKLLSRDGSLIMMNPAGLAMIEADSIERVKGQDVCSLVAAPYRDAFRKVIEDIFAGRNSKMEFEAVGLKGRKLWLATHAVPLRDETGNIIALLGITRDMTAWKTAEEELRRAHDGLEEKVKVRTEVLKKLNEQMEVKSRSLEELNSALKVLLAQRGKDKKEFEKRILSNIRELILPIVEELKKSTIDPKYESYLNILESNLLEITGPFSMELSSEYVNLTPVEIKVANFIKQGKRAKEIAEILNISTATVNSHRNHIRKKLGLISKKTNLTSYLNSIK